MRIAASVVQPERLYQQDERKRQQLRKEAGDAYKKNADYFQPAKNSALAELEQLLSGKNQKLVKDDYTLEEKKQIADLAQADREVRAHEQAHKSVGGAIAGAVSLGFTEGPDGKRYATSGEVSISAAPASDAEETIAILERVRQAALAPANPSAQDLKIAASAVSQIEQVRAKAAAEVEEAPPFADEDTTIEVPERFTLDTALDPTKETIFGRNLEQLMKERLFAKATATYGATKAMVANGYKSFVEPAFSQTA